MPHKNARWILRKFEAEGIRGVLYASRAHFDIEMRHNAVTRGVKLERICFQVHLISIS